MTEMKAMKESLLLMLHSHKYEMKTTLFIHETLMVNVSRWLITSKENACANQLKASRIVQIFQ